MPQPGLINVFSSVNGYLLSGRHKYRNLARNLAGINTFLAGSFRLAIVALGLILYHSGSAQNAIVTENALTGNLPSEWDISGAGDLTIQGFATDISVNKGQTIRFKIKTNANAYTIAVYRLGYYNGRGARKMGVGIITAGLPQSQPSDLTVASTGLIDCGNWAESAHWDVPATAVSGIYIAKIIRTDTKGASHIAFIVRDDASTAPCFFKTSDCTWQAYNGYGGNSLYVGNTSYPGGHAAKVSYNRPFLTRSGGGGGGVAEDWLFNAEFPMIRWLERNGYDLSYTTDVDADRRGTLIKNHKIFMSVGHDEYWSGNERANVEAARAAGVNLAFFSSNEIYWKTRWEASIDGTNTANRTLVCYKEGTLGENVCGGKCDPLANVWTGLWRDGCSFTGADGCRPENALSGQISWRQITGAITVPDTYKSYRFWRNTSVATLGTGQTATLADGSLGYEIDYEQNNGAYPAGRVNMSQTQLSDIVHKVSLYRAPGAGLVFATGTGQWSWGLDGTHDRGTSTPDVKMQQATVNIFADLGAQPASIQSGLTIASPVNDIQAPNSVITAPKNGAVVVPNAAVTITGTVTESQGIIAGVEISVDGGLHWSAVTGTSNWSYTWTPTVQGTYNIKTRSFDDMANLETAATAFNSITVSTNGTACTPPTAVLAAAGADCQGKTIALKLNSATGTGPYSVIVNNQLYTNATVGANFATVPVEQSIWGTSGTPQSPNENDGQPLEVGLKFRSTQNGTITGVRFLKGANNTGTHTGSLWSSAGTRLATVSFTGETASGWQEMRFASPVAITANTTYIVSYYSPGGGYSSTDNTFASAPVTSGALIALQQGTDGSNGLYKYGASSFPDQSFNSSNYWVDVLFNASSYTFTLTSITDATGCNNTGNISTVTIAQSSLPSGSVTFYQDKDNDGYGNPSVTVTGCVAPAGYVSQSGDCNDNDATIHPGAAEICGDGKDNNCNGVVDEGCATMNTYYRDADNDGYGNPALSTTGTTAPAGYVTNNTDCNDGDATIHPGATELCDGKDNNCDGRIDEGCTIYYRDLDNDGYGNAAVTITATTKPAGYVTNNTDCNDNSAAVHPGATEICGNGIDDNCNGTVDEGCTVATEQSIWGTTGTPLTPNDYDGGPIETGVKFRVDKTGTLTGIRFFKGLNNTGTHTGNLWSATGTKLATATFTNETASGWQEARFSTPVSLNANTTYVASCYASSGKYPSSANFFTSTGKTSGSITALQSGIDGSNGVYRFGSTGFPTSSYAASNYWVDVLFKPNTTLANALTITQDAVSLPAFMSPALLQIKIIPNPASTFFKLQASGGSGDPIELSVVDAAGRLLENKRWLNPGAGMEIGNNYRAGSYIIKATQGKTVLRFTLIKLSR